ncbi:hypothetical protein L1987_51193 [Smallanthus sonchifolius]|uniref:Uncharacterized protein n=1 Tax=Smallanthus sonchifolius TaxID=185202 RepID=A0ACB9EP47_9ASTR|nr:hypothetical protein L1987_51193 [Smallanthus sonchifolius]
MDTVKVASSQEALASLGSEEVVASGDQVMVVDNSAPPASGDQVMVVDNSASPASGDQVMVVDNLPLPAGVDVSSPRMVYEKTLVMQKHIKTKCSGGCGGTINTSAGVAAGGFTLASKPNPTELVADADFSSTASLAIKS